MARKRHHPPHGKVRTVGPPSGRLARAFGERDEYRSCARRYARREDPAISSRCSHRSHAFRSGPDRRSDTATGHDDRRAVRARGCPASEGQLCEQMEVVDGHTAQRRVLTEPTVGVPGNGVADTMRLPVRRRSADAAHVVARGDAPICRNREALRVSDRHED